MHPLGFCLSLLLGLVTLPSLSPVQAAEKPHILLIMADDLGWMDLHCQGNALLDTPHLDQLASEGIRFTDAYAAAPVCTPTRAAIMTGLSPARLHITNHAPGNPEFVSPATGLKGAPWTTYLSLAYDTLAEHLQRAGYRNGFVGKWHLSHHKGSDASGRLEPRLRPEFQGFDLNVGGCDYGGPPSYFAPYRNPALKDGPEGEYLPDRLANECIAFLETPSEKPLFLCWWNYSVHYPIQAPQDLVEKYQQRQGVQRPAYYAMIEGMDRAIGKVLKHLETSGKADETLVIFTSDNGSLFENLPLRANKGYLYEGGIRVPWIMRWPGEIEAGKTSSLPVISSDLFPTLLDVAGWELSETDPLDGESLKGWILGEIPLKRNALYFHYPNYAFHKNNRLGSAIRKGHHKLIHFYDDDSLELYDLEKDLAESKDLSASSPELARALKLELDQWRQRTRAIAPTRVALP